MSAVLFDRGSAGPDPRWGGIGELLRGAGRQFGSREFLRFPAGSLAFAETDELSDRLARALMRHGIQAGDRVAIMLGNTPEWPLSWFAILKAGAIAVPVNARYREADLTFVLADSGAVLVLAAPELVGLVRRVATGIETVREVCTVSDLAREASGGGLPRGTDALISNFQYTSGTTGFPKACVLSHDYWLRTAWLTAIEAELRDDDVMLMAQAFSYMDPQWAAVMCLMGGIPLVVLPRFSASGFWASVREHSATVSYVLGAMPMLMYAQPPGPLDRDNEMRLVLCSGIVPELHRRFEKRWDTPWREIYGSTESGLVLAVPPGATEATGTGAMGRPVAGKQVEIVDEEGNSLPDGAIGEIVIRGKPMMDGYWNHPDSTAFRDGWYHSGDLGYRDARGWLHHVGRLKDMIRRGGENVSAAEVENVLVQHPAVAAAALVPVPDDLFGEVAKAFIQLSPGYDTSTHTALSVLEHVRRKLARFKVPAFLEFVESFPMTPSARIQKSKLTQGERVFDVAARSWT